MKRLFAAAPALLLCLCLCACGVPHYTVTCGVRVEENGETDYPIVEELKNDAVQTAVNDLLMRHSFAIAEEGQTYQLRLCADRLSIQYYGGSQPSGITVDMKSGRQLSLAEVIDCPQEELFDRYLFGAYRESDGLPDLDALEPLFDPSAEHLYDFFLSSTELFLILQKPDGETVILRADQKEFDP